MPCPTCDHEAMPGVSTESYWCPRCGTIRQYGTAHMDSWGKHIKLTRWENTTAPTHRDDLARHARRLAECIRSRGMYSDVDDDAERVLELTEERDGEA